MERQDYYVYRHLDKRGKTRFVGHGTGKASHSLSGRTKAHADFLKFIKQMHGSLDNFVEILHSGLTKTQAEQMKSYEMDRRGKEHVHGLFNCCNPNPYSGYVNSRARILVEPPEFFERR